MVTTASNNFEGGTDGVAVSTGNSGGASGTAFDSIWGTGLTYSASNAYQGSMGATVAGSAFGAGVWNVSSTKFSAHLWFKLSAVPTTGDLYLIRGHASSTRLVDVHVQGTGKLRVFDASGATVWTSTNTLSANTWYRLELYAVSGSTTSNGTIKTAFYLGGSSSPVETQYFANGTANVGAAQTFTSVILGKYNNTVEAYSFDSLAVDTTLSDYIGLPTATPPTVSTPANQNVSAGATVSESVTASSSSGTISSYAWSFTYPSSGAPSLTGGTTANASFTAGSAGALYILQCVVTDSNALTTTVTTEVRVPTSGDATILSGASTTSVGTWSNVGGASTGGDALADASDTTYIESAALSGTATSIRYRLQPMTARSALNLTVRLAQDTSGSTTETIKLYEGATLRQSWTTPTITTSFADYVLSLTSPGAIADWGNLYLEAAATSP